jgi:tight adherence protein B
MNPLDWAILWVAAVSVGFSGWLLFRSFLPSLSFPVPGPFLPARLQRATPLQKKLIAGLLIGLSLAAFADPFWASLLLLTLLGAWTLSQKAPSWRTAYEDRRRVGRTRDLFPQAVGMAIQGLKVGQTMPQVVEYLSRECPEPLAGEFSLARAEMDLGASAETALTKMSDRFGGFPEFQQFLEAYRVSQRTGASLTRLLETLLEGLEEKNRLLRKMEAMTAQARLSGLMMGLLPLLLALVFFLMDPDLLTPLFTQKTGWAILALAVFLETIGFLWIRQLLRLEV